MNILRWAEFASDFPEDGVEDEDGVLQFRARALTQAIVEILEGLGFRVSPPEYDDHGWGFDFWASERRFWCQVTAWDDTYALLINDVSRTLTDKLFKREPSPIYVDVMKRLSEVLGSDPRLQDVQWFSDDDVGSRRPGAASPLELDD